MSSKRFGLLLSQRDPARPGRLHRCPDPAAARPAGRRSAARDTEPSPEMVETALDGLRLQFPGYAEEISRRFVSAARRCAWRSAVRRLRAEGLIGAEVYTALMQDIGARRRIAEQRRTSICSCSGPNWYNSFRFRRPRQGRTGAFDGSLQTRYVGAGATVVDTGTTPAISSSPQACGKSGVGAISGAWGGAKCLARCWCCQTGPNVSRSGRSRPQLCWCYRTSHSAVFSNAAR